MTFSYYGDTGKHDAFFGVLIAVIALVFSYGLGRFDGEHSVHGQYRCLRFEKREIAAPWYIFEKTIMDIVCVEAVIK